MNKNHTLTPNNVDRRKQEGYSPCNNCAQHKGPTFSLFFSSLTETTKQTNDSICAKIKEHMMKHISLNQTEEERRRKKKRDFFSHYLVSVKNRNSPVTFTLHFLDYIHLYTWISLNYLSLSFMSINSLQKKEKFAIKCINSSRKMCLVTFL